MKRHFASILLLSFAFAPALSSQTPAEKEEARRSPGLGRLAVSYDLSSGQLGAALPFDVPFDLVAEDTSRTIRAVAVSLFEAKEPFQVVPCGSTSSPTCPQESWRCIAEERPGKTFQVIWARDYGPSISDVKCSFVPDVAALAPVQKSDSTTALAFYLPFPPLRANKEYQILLRYVERQNTSDTKAQEVLAAFRRQVPAHLERHLRDLVPLTGELGAFRAFAKSLLDDLKGAARSHGLELVADPQDPLLQVLGAAGVLPVEDDLVQLLKREVPDLLTERERLPNFIDQCKAQLSSMQLSLGDLLTAIEGARADGALPNDLTQLIREARLEPLLAEDARDRLAPLAQVQVPDPCSEVDGSVLTGASAAYGRLRENLRGLQQALGQRQPPVTAIVQAAGTAADTAFRLQDFTRRIAGVRTRFGQTLTTLAEALTRAAVQDRLLFARASTIGTFDSRQKWRIAGDFGFAYAPELGEAAPYVGTNFYFRPVNKQAPLEGFQPGRRLSATMGLVLTDIGDGRTRDALLTNGNFSLLAGGSVRVTDAIRLGGGFIVFRKRNPDPLIDDSSLALSHYVSLSLDWDLQDLIQWFRKVFSLGT